MKSFFFVLTALFVLQTANSQEHFLEKVRGKYKYGLKDKSGKLLFKPKYDFIDDFKNGFARVKLNEKCGFINESGIEIVPTIYNEVRDFTSSMAGIKLENKWGLIDTTGKVVLTPKYQFPIDYNIWSEYIEVAVPNPNDQLWGNSLYGLLDLNLNEIVAPKYHSIKPIDLGYFLVGMGIMETNYGLLNQKYKLIIPINYKNVLPVANDLIYALNSDNYWTLFNSKGSRIGNYEYEKTFGFSNGRSKVKRNGKYGFLNAEGFEIIACIFDEADTFKTGANNIKVKRNGREYFIDKNGKELLK